MYKTNDSYILCCILEFEQDFLFSRPENLNMMIYHKLNLRLRYNAPTNWGSHEMLYWILLCKNSIIRTNTKRYGEQLITSAEVVEYSEILKKIIQHRFCSSVLRGFVFCFKVLCHSTTRTRLRLPSRL